MTLRSGPVAPLVPVSHLRYWRRCFTCAAVRFIEPRTLYPPRILPENRLSMFQLPSHHTSCEAFPRTSGLKSAGEPRGNFYTVWCTTFWEASDPLRDPGHIETPWSSPAHPANMIPRGVRGASMMPRGTRPSDGAGKTWRRGGDPPAIVRDRYGAGKLFPCLCCPSQVHP